MVMAPGSFDQKGRPGVIGCHDSLPLNVRRDVITFQTPELDRDTEVTGPIEMRLWASSSALDTDFTAKLIDVYPPSDNFPDGLAFNITDSIIRARYRNGWDSPEDLEPGTPYEFVFQLYPTSNIFRKGHRIRLDISSSNWPRFDVNPNTGGPTRNRQGLHHRHPDHLPRPIPPLPRHPSPPTLTLLLHVTWRKFQRRIGPV